MKNNETYHPRGKKVDGFKPHDHPSYQSWAAMKTRCRNPKEKSFKNYGARGIDYCKEWEHFKIFAHDMGVRPSKYHSIERIDNNHAYPVITHDR